MKRCKSPRDAFDHLEKWYDPESKVATQKLYDKFFYDFTIYPNSNPIEALHTLEDTSNQMTEKGVGIPNTFLHARSVRALPDEYGHVKATLQAMNNRDRAEFIRVVGTRHSTLPQKTGLQRSFLSPEQAFFSSKRGGRSGTRRGCGHGRGGTQGRSRDRSNSKGGGSISGGGSSSARSTSGNSHGDGSISHGRCWRCNRRGHIREQCTTKESDFLAKCARYSGFGHEEST